MRLKAKEKHTIGLLPKALAIIVLTNLIGANAREMCEGIGFMPTELVPMRAKEQIQIQNDDEINEIVDVHIYNHFYTFQVDRDIGKVNEGIEMLIPAEKFFTNSDGFAFRLRAEFNSAEGSRTEMGFRVMLQSKNKDSDIRTTISEASTLDLKYGEDTAQIDLPLLPYGTDYVLRYEFYMKEVIRRVDSLSIEEDTVASRDALVQCNLPFFTQELSLVDRKVLKSRVKKYL